MKRFLLLFLFSPVFAASLISPFKFVNNSVFLTNESAFITYWDCDGEYYSLKEFFDSYVFVLYLQEEQLNCEDYTLLHDGNNYNLLHFTNCSFYDGGDFYYYTWSCGNYSHFALETLNESQAFSDFLSVCNSNNSVKSLDYSNCSYEGASFRGEYPGYITPLLIQEFDYVINYDFSYEWNEPDNVKCKGGESMKFCTKNNYEYIVYGEDYSYDELPVLSFNPNLASKASVDYFLIFIIIVLLLFFLFFKSLMKH